MRLGITVWIALSLASTALAQGPKASAGPDQTVVEETSGVAGVTLDGSGSTGGEELGVWSSTLTRVTRGNASGTIRWDHPGYTLPYAVLSASLQIQAWDVRPDENDLVAFVDAENIRHPLGELTPGLAVWEETTSTFSLDPSWIGANGVEVYVESGFAPAIQVSTLTLHCAGLAYEWYEGSALLGVGELIHVTLSTGTHTVELVVTDAAGNEDSDAAVISVSDAILPEIDPIDDIIVEQETPDGTAVEYTATATDGSGGELSDITFDPPSGTVFPLGSTTVTCTGTDDSGQSASITFTVTVEDTTAPEMRLECLRDELWSPNGALVLCAQVSDVHDVCDAESTVEIEVTSNEPVIGPGRPQSQPDWLVVEHDSVWEIYLSAERSGASSGRVYTITATATDDSGNVAMDQTDVTVPHSQTNRPH